MFSFNEMCLNRRLAAAILAAMAPAVSAKAQEAIASVQAVAPTPPIAPKTVEVPTPLAVVLPLPPAPNSDVPGGPITADEAALIALRHHFSIDVARAGVVSADGRLQLARAGLAPGLTLSTGYTDQETLSGTTSTGASSGTGDPTASSTSSTGYNAAANVRQLLFDFNHTRDLVRQSAGDRRAAAANLTRAQNDQVLQVKQNYYALTQNSRLVAVNESNLNSQKAHLDLAMARLNSGLGQPADVVRAQVAVGDATIGVEQARNAAGISRIVLAEAMGIDPRTPISPADSTEPPPPTDDMNALIDLALKQRPDVAQAEASVESAEAALSAAKTVNAPTLSGSLGVTARGPNFIPRNSSLTVGATVSWPVFDGGGFAGRTKSAQGALTSVRAQLIGVRTAAISDVAQAYLNLRTAEQRATTSAANAANAGESVRLFEGRYRAGLGTLIDVTDSQSALLTAETNRVNAEAAVNLARAALARAIGASLPTR